MKRTMNVLLTLAISASVVGFAYYLSEIVAVLTGNSTGNRYLFSADDRAISYAKFITYWLTGFIGLYVCGRVVRTRNFTLNALMIAFGYLLILGSHGGLSFEGSYSLKAALSALNAVIFAFTYLQFEKKYYPKEG